MKPINVFLRSTGKKQGRLVHLFHHSHAYWFYPITPKRKTLIWGKGFVKNGTWITFSAKELTADPHHPLYTHTLNAEGTRVAPIGWLALPKGDDPGREPRDFVPLNTCYYFTMKHAETMFIFEFPEEGEVLPPRENYYHPGYRWQYKGAARP